MAEDKNNALYENYSNLSVEHLRAKQEELKISIKNCHVSLGTKVWNAAESVMFAGFYGGAAGGSALGVANRDNINWHNIGSGFKVTGAPDVKNYRANQYIENANPILKDDLKSSKLSFGIGIVVAAGAFVSNYRRLNKLALIQDETSKVSRLSMVEEILRDKALVGQVSKKQQVMDTVLANGEAKGAQL